MTTEVDRPITAGRILGLALPALGVLAAPPLYLLLDTAVIGRLGAVELAALAAGATVFSMLTAQLTFLAYGTTARASRAFGRGDVRGAVSGCSPPTRTWPAPRRGGCASPPRAFR